MCDSDNNQLAGLELLKGRLSRLRLLSVGTEHHYLERNPVNEELGEMESLIEVASRPALRFMNLPGSKITDVNLQKSSLTDHELVLLLTNLPQLTQLYAGTLLGYSGNSPRQTASAFRTAVPQLSQLNDLTICKSSLTQTRLP
mgnify:FL=1